MRNHTSLAQLFVAPFLAVLLCAPTWAADPDDAEDPPDRVARVSYLSGKAVLQSADDDDWTELAVNRPLTSGDRLRLEPSARAEMQIGNLDLQIDERSDFSFSELSDNVAQLRLTDGALHLEVRRLVDGEVIEVDTPHAAVTIVKPGEYSIALRDNGARTQVKTYLGAAEVSDHNETLAIKAGEQASFFASELNPSRSAAIEPIRPRDAFDAWAHGRGEGYERSASARYVAPDVIGYRDLDGYGDWVEEVDYGYVWYPTRVAVGWSPYRFGHWAWVGPWGWTWIDDSPWGFAPFHYGRWASVRGRWCWVPGPRHVRAVYAPALVAWVGSAPPRGGVHVSVSFGNVGWFPLAPREVFVPGYRCSRNHIHNVNYANTVVNVRYINRVYNDRSTHFDYVNRRVHDSVVVTRSDAFAASRPVRDHMVRVEPRELDGWRTRNTAPEVSPVRTHTTSAVARAVDHGPPREVITRHAPSPRNFGRNDAIAGQRGDSMARERGRETDRPGMRWDGGQQSPRNRVQEAGQAPAVPATTASPAPTPRAEIERNNSSRDWRGRERDTRVQDGPNRFERRERPNIEQPPAQPQDFGRAPREQTPQVERRQVEPPRFERRERPNIEQPPAQPQDFGRAAREQTPQVERRQVEQPRFERRERREEFRAPSRAPEPQRSEQPRMSQPQAVQQQAPAPAPRERQNDDRGRGDRGHRHQED